MPKPDLSGLSLDELSAVIEEATKLRASKVEAKRQELQKQLAELDAIAGTVEWDRGASNKHRAPRKKVFRGPSGREYANSGAIPTEFKEMGIKDKAGMEPYRIK